MPTRSICLTKYASTFCRASIQSSQTDSSRSLGVTISSRGLYQSPDKYALLRPDPWNA